VLKNNIIFGEIYLRQRLIANTQSIDILEIEIRLII